MLVEPFVPDRRNAPRRFVVALLLAFTLTVAVSTSWAQNAPSDAVAYAEDEVKAAFLYHFSTYVEWPTGSDDEVTIAVFGAPDVADELTRFVRGRTIQGRPVRVRRLRTLRELDDDDVLYIGPAENRRLEELIETVRGWPTLLVTDAPDGLSQGGMINFRVLDRRVRFEVSVPRAQDAGLTLSSRLLSAALYVETSHNGYEPPLRPVFASAQNRAAAMHRKANPAQVRVSARAART